jgi:hypothetical protein
MWIKVKKSREHDKIMFQEIREICLQAGRLLDFQELVCFIVLVCF